MLPTIVTESVKADDKMRFLSEVQIRSSDPGVKRWFCSFNLMADERLKNRIGADTLFNR